MMHATDDDSPEMDETAAAALRKFSLDGATDKDNNAGDDRSDSEAPSRSTRPRHQSDTEMRNELEKRRETSRNEKTRSSLTNNRFLAKKTATKAPKERPEQDGGGDDDEDAAVEPQVQDESDDDAAAIPTVPNLTATTKKRSSVATPAAQPAAADRAHGDTIVRPQVHLLPSFAMKSSKWTQELQDEELCGLFVDEKRTHLTKIHPSTLVRLEERLTREQRPANDDEDEDPAHEKAERNVRTTTTSASSFPLMDLIHTTTRRTHFSTRRPSVATYEEIFSAAFQDSQIPPKRAANAATFDTRETAMLEICVDRLILDDHASFALQDRTGAQLRSLYASYGNVQQQQPWRLHLDRIDAFIDAFCKETSSEKAGGQHPDAFMAKWKAQTASDTELALNELTKLQLLHQQLLVKWTELQECARTSSFLPYLMKTFERGDPITLTRVQAFIEILEDRVRDHTNDENQSEEDARASAHVEYFTARLEALQVQDKCLSQVLRLEAQSHPSEAHGSRNTATSLSRSRERVVQHRPPKFYVVIYVNDRQAFATKARSWDGHHHQSTVAHRKVPRGLVLFDETFRLKLPFFPESLSAKVFEQGFIFDTAISTTSVPVVLPGQDIRDVSARIPVASLAPSHEWYQFSSTTAISRSKWHSSFLHSSLYVNFTRRPHGRVHIKMTWMLPVHWENGPPREGPSQQVTEPTCYLPPKRPPLLRALQRNDSANVIGSRHVSSAARHTREELNKSGFSYERDFLVHMKALDSVVDPNDPENTAAVRLQKHLKAQSELMTKRDVFRTSALAFEHSKLFYNSQFASSTSLTKRNLLLQMRDREHAPKFGISICEAAACREDALPSRSGIEDTRWQHAVFEDPVPLEEGEIATNEKYLALLRPEIKGYDHRLRVEHAEEGDLYSIERQRKLNLLRIHDFIDKVKQNQLVTKRKTVAKEKIKTLASIIQEQPLPLFPGTFDLSGLSRIFAPRRRLRPQAAKRSTPSALAEWPNCCNLYIQVQKAFNVPVRRKQRRSAVPLTAVSRTKSKTNDRKAKQSASKDPDDGVEEEDNEVVGNEVRSLRQPPSYESQIFVEICFQGKKRKTACSLVSTSSTNSSNPVWMETLVVPFRPPLDDWSPESIQQCQDEIRINLFDQVVVLGEGDDDRLETMADRNGMGAQLSSFHQENYFLGGLCIPFTTLYHNNGSLEATLRCEMPIEHLGYVNLKSADDGDGSIGIGTPRSSIDDETPRPNSKSPAKRGEAMDEKDEDGVKKSSREATFLSLMMTLDPLLPLPVKSFEDIVASIGTSDDTSEGNKRLAQYANDWTLKTQNTNAATKHRKFHVFVHSLNNGNTFLSQYLSAQPPPRAGVFSKTATTLQKLVRFVKLIPFLDDWHLFDGEKDIWSTSQEFLGINAGDYEEHAILLCNYFQWLDRNEPNYHNYLVVGHAVPEGDGVYVLRQDAYKIPQRSVLWNASTGVGYHVWDDRCPMQDVSLIVSSDNIFANLQQTPRFRDLNWDIETNPKAWKPFFHPTTIQKDTFTLPCVQSRELRYEETPDEYINRVEMEIRETLKLEIRRWRSSRFTTTFNIDASMKLRGHLEELERHMQGQQSLELTGEKKSGDTNVLHELRQTKEISGMPLNLTFTDLDKVVDLVKNTASRSCVFRAARVYFELTPADLLSLCLICRRTSTGTSARTSSSHSRCTSADTQTTSCRYGSTSSRSSLNKLWQ